MAAIGPICDGLVTIGTWALRAKPVAELLAGIANFF
jgi:hypothetical protein